MVAQFRPRMASRAARWLGTLDSLHLSSVPGMLPRMGSHSQASASLTTGLEAVEDILSFAKGGRGKPSKQENSLFVASVALSYAVWENFVEDLAIETTQVLSAHLRPERVPDACREHIEEKRSAWELAIYPGWQALWVSLVRDFAKGKPGDERYSFHTADSKGVTKLFGRVGVDPFHDLPAAKREELNELVELRGQIVHTGSPPDHFRKRDAISSLALVRELASHLDRVVGDQIVEMTEVGPPALWPGGGSP